MSIKKWSTVLGVIVILSMLLSACATPTPQVIEKIVEKPVEKIVEKVVEKPIEKVVEKEKQVVVTATPVPPTPVPPKPAEKAVDTAVIALQQEPDTLHAGIGSMMARTIVLSPINVGCMRQNEKTEWIPLGCETVPTIDNGGAKWVGEGADKHLEVTYKIKKGWRWTDGTPVTSADVLTWWKLHMDPEFEIASRVGIQKIYDIKVVDPNTVTVIWLSNNQAKSAEAGTLKGNVPFEKYVDDYKGSGLAATGQPVVDSVYWTFIGWYPAHIVGKVAAKDQKTSDYAKKPIGDGAYVVKEWKAGQEIVLEKSDKPFPLGDPKIKTIVWRFFGESKAVLASLQKGEIDAISTVAGVTPSDSPDLDKIAAAGIYKVSYFTEYSWEHIDLNVQKFPLDDMKVRQALYYAIDKKTIIDTLYFGKYAPAELPGAILKTNSGFFTDDFTKYPFDKAKAQALLKEAGWDCKALPCTKKVTVDGKEVTKNLEITLMTTDRADRQKLAQVIQSMWKAVNVGTNIQFLYGRGLFQPCSAGGPLYCRTYDAAIYTWVGGDDPGFWGLYGCSGIPTKDNNWSGQNNPGWCNKDADKALNDAENNADIVVSPAKRKTAYAPFFKAWTTEVPVIPLFVNAVPIAARTGFKNYTCGPTNSAPCGWNAWQWELSK
jgi:peptide/nickel transport system substrate-binding protein